MHVQGEYRDWQSKWDIHDTSPESTNNSLSHVTHYDEVKWGKVNEGHFQNDQIFTVPIVFIVFKARSVPADDVDNVMASIWFV